MIGGLAPSILITLFTLAVMAAMSAWTSRRLPPGPVPIHFDIRGRADRFGARWIPLALLPLSYIPIAGLTIALHIDAEPDRMRDLFGGQLFMAVLIPAAHALVMWLLLRWARQQDS